MNYEDIVCKLREHFTFYRYAQKKASGEHGDEVISECKYTNIWTWEQVMQTHTPGWNLMVPIDTIHQSDYKTLKSKVDLKESALMPKEKTRLMYMIMKYYQTFSIMEEIGECPNIKTDIKVIDESSFFVRPFSVSEEDKPLMDKQMERLVSLGILTKNNTSHNSPVMLITRKLTKN